MLHRARSRHELVDEPSSSLEITENYDGHAECPPCGDARPGTVVVGRKLNRVLALVSRGQGATLEELVHETGWLPHTVRAAITRLRRRGIQIGRECSGDGQKVYHALDAKNSKQSQRTTSLHDSSPDLVTISPPGVRNSTTQSHCAQPGEGTTVALFPTRAPRLSEAGLGPDWCAALARLEGAFSRNTVRCYGSDFRLFETWCVAQRRSALPATPETVVEHLRDIGRRVSPATISRRCAAISRIHKLMKLENPIATEDVGLAVRALCREKGRRHKQALGLTSELRLKILAACPGNLRGLRDRALIAVGYDTLCRRSELVELRIQDLEVKPDGSGTILIRRAKADQLGDGRLAYISVQAMTHLRRWLRAAKLNSGLIFRGFHSDVPLDDGMNAAAVAVTLKARAEAAGLEHSVVEKLSGHSMRVGAAQDMAAAAIDLGAIMHAGGWKSPAMVMRYIEHMDVQKSGMARLYGAFIKS